MNPEDQIEELVKQMKTANVEMAVRKKARLLIDEYYNAFGLSEDPINIEALAQLIGIKKSNQLPVYSNDAELAVDDNGELEMRINRDQPETRQRFSIAHEISHTFFSDYSRKTQCRTDARHRLKNDSSDKIEILCDIAASEILFPLKCFSRDIEAVKYCSDLMSLVEKYKSSKEATLRRYVEIHPRSMAAIFLSWKLKPTQKKEIEIAFTQKPMFELDQTELKEARMLRVSYKITSEKFNDEEIFIPKDKSIFEGPIQYAAKNRLPMETITSLKIGSCSGIFNIQAIPVYTPIEEQGPNGESNVIAVIEPVKIFKNGRKKIKNPELFDET